MRIAAIEPPDVPPSAQGYSPAILAEGRKILFVSGQCGDDLNADLETQFRQTFEKIRRILEAAGGSFKNVVMMRYYLVNMERDLPILRKVRLDFLSKPYPASTAVGVTALAIQNLQFEIEAIAVL
jgi:enamine deaminase RidA (YjgF/YER057c/UK114 family)